jgi:hypothetical protein
MQPIQINTTNSQLTDLTFEREHKNITITLDADDAVATGVNNTIPVMMRIPRSMIDNFSFETSSTKSAAESFDIQTEVKTSTDGKYNILRIILPHTEKDKIQLLLSQNAISIK